MPYENGQLSIKIEDYPEQGHLSYMPPADVKQWWCAEHCGPATEDPTEVCGFCGRPVLECAKALSEQIQKHPEWNHDGSILGTPNDDPELEAGCGGSGFWCSGCGRFWAQDSCGESGCAEHHASDGAELQVRGNKVYCVCGKWLMTVRPEENYQ